MNHWYSRRDMPGHPDYVLFDLDPAEGSGFREAVRVALLVREVLGLLGLVGYAKTSSARGLHVMVPVDRVHTFEEARAFCRLVGSALEQTHRGLVTTEWAKERRRGVLVDANQVAYAKTISSVYSVRPRPGAPVSTPLEWDEVDEELDPRELTMAVALDRVQRRGDLFAPVLAGGQRLGPAIARIRGANP
jgi:bifunctional non-homologous end joining protein LigD